MKLPALYSFQETAAKKVEGRKRVGFLVYFGGGKTYLSLRWLETLTKPFPCLILCPKSAVTQWGTEIEKFTTFSYVLVEGTARQRAQALEKEVQLFVANYDAIRSDHSELLSPMSQRCLRRQELCAFVVYTVSAVIFLIALFLQDV